MLAENMALLISVDVAPSSAARYIAHPMRILENTSI